jgi:hypothetical protein
MTNISRFIKIICHNYYKYLLDIIKKIYTEYIYDIQNVFLILFLFSSSFSVLYLILYLMLHCKVSECCSIKFLKVLESLIAIIFSLFSERQVVIGKYNEMQLEYNDIKR